MDHQPTSRSGHFSAARASNTSLDTDARSDTQERDGRQRRTKARLVELLFAAGRAASAKKVAQCNADYFTLACRNGHCATSVPSFRCRHRLCPYCAASRQRRAFLRFLPILENYACRGNGQPVLITLTVQSSLRALAVEDKEFKAAFGRLRRLKRWKDHISGALCGYEFTLTPNGWHYHAHILAFRKTWYDQRELAQDWQRSARTSIAIVDIRAISNLSDGLRSTLQYCFKPTELDNWTANEIKQFSDLHRIKLSDCFGSFRGLRVSQAVGDDDRRNKALFVGCPCPECGEPLMRIKLSWRQLNAYMRIAKDWFASSRAGPVGVS